MTEESIQQIERYVREAMSRVTAPDLRIAHDFKHVDRVRGWALRIAGGEAFGARALVEATALLHDIGLIAVEADQRHRHGEVGATLAARFLRDHRLFEEGEIEQLVEAIRFHNTPGGGGPLGALLRDADKLDALGAVGIMRAFTSKYAKPEYPPADVKGETWELPMSGFEARFATGEGIGPCIVDQINFQISFYGDLCTPTAKRLGEPLVAFMRAYVLQLESEIASSQAGT